MCFNNLKSGQRSYYDILNLAFWAIESQPQNTEFRTDPENFPLGAVWSGSLLFAIKDTKEDKQMSEQTSIVVNHKSKGFNA